MRQVADGDLRHIGQVRDLVPEQLGVQQRAGQQDQRRSGHGLTLASYGFLLHQSTRPAVICCSISV